MTGAGAARTPLTVGTAGHIDHGKTWLVRALTGKDTDRLPEEQRRGISIDLGYAPLELRDGRRLSLVDVPGHERFVRTMVAGATGIDLFLLVIDGGEGARPQTHEHLAILRLLGIAHGVVAVTKSDAVDAETLELALEEARDLVPEALSVAVSAKTGDGLEDLRVALASVADGIARARSPLPTRLWIDRSFTLRGIGTVVTGTLWSGAIASGDELRLEPRGRDVRVRSVQVHDTEVGRAEAGQRVAVSLPGVERTDVRRGDALVARSSYPRTFRLDVALEELVPIADGAQAQVHVGTTAVPARIVRVGERWAQLRLSSAVVAARGDHVVLRAETTLGGGLVLDPSPPRHRSAERMQLVESGDVARTVHAPVPIASLRHLVPDLQGLERAGPWVFSREWLEELEQSVRRRLEQADPLDPGLAPPAEAWAGDIIPLLSFERRGAKLYLPGATPSLGGREDEAVALERELEAAGARATKVEDQALARFLESGGRIVRLGDGYAVSTSQFEAARRAAVDECLATGELTLARFRDLLGIGRRDAQLLLERLDADGVTRRIGDRRVLRRSAAAATRSSSS
jgi:selenocysteine-specific elongation factor